MISREKISLITKKEILPAELTTQELVEFCEYCNVQYRYGSPIISDEDYDFIFLKALKERAPNHKFFKIIEPEIIPFSEEKIVLPETMLSTEKAYSFDEIIKWTDRILKSCKEISFEVSKLIFKATPKLDGFAGYDDGNKLFTRGDGKKGSDITRVFNRGLKIYNNSSRGQGAGEIVVSKSYFEQNLVGYFEFPRNFQASLIKEKELDDRATNAIKIMEHFLFHSNNCQNGKGH